ncbi:hypothetical protein FB451DRAFT_1364210 [Mycena latifolia]|nr:hypothetical protein FB451DRAFT_1364210 [Mycena latifolia]
MAHWHARWQLGGDSGHLVGFDLRCFRLLHGKGFGCALFELQLSDDLPSTLRQTGTRIGDVGIVTRNGGFEPIFNILDRADNYFGVPQGFEQVPESDELIRRLLNKFTVETTSDEVYLQDRSSDKSISAPPGQQTALDNVQNDGRLQPPLDLPAWDSSLEYSAVDSPDREYSADSLEDSPALTVAEYTDSIAACQVSDAIFRR